MEPEAVDLESHLDLLFESAKTAHYKARHAAALEVLSVYLQHRPDHPWACYLFARSLQKVGLFAEAERAFLRAAEFEENHPRCQIWLAILYKSFGHYDRAEPLFELAVKHPKAAEWGWAWIFRGTNFAAQNQFEAAIACHRRALELADTDFDEAWLNIGLISRCMGKYDQAIEAFNRALEITPDYGDVVEALESMTGIQDAIALAKRTPMPGRSDKE